MSWWEPPRGSRAARAPYGAVPLAPPWAPLAALGAVVVTGMIAALVWHSNQLYALDAWAARGLVARSYWEVRTASAISTGLGYLAVAAATVIAVFAGVALRWRNAVLLVLVAPALAFAAEKLLKVTVDRRVVGSTVSHYPSGHLAVATAVVLSLVLLLRSAGAMARARAVVAAATGLLAVLAVTRQVDTAHLLSDVVGGMATGVAVTLAAALLLDRSPPPRGR